MKRVVVLLFCAGLLIALGCSSLSVSEYPISLYYPDSRLSTLLWFRPPYCLYELWSLEALDPSQATRWTATIEMEVKLAGDKSTYKAVQRFPIPICSPTMAQSLTTGDRAYEMGPTLTCLNDTCTRAVLPGRKYSVRYLLYAPDRTLLATTNWSRYFHTRDLPRDFRTIDVDFGGHSTGMVVITVLVSLALFLLLGAAGLALVVRRL